MNARDRAALIVAILVAMLVVAGRAWRARMRRAHRAPAPTRSSVVYSWGSNAHGELGVVPPNTHVPSVIDKLPEVVALAAGFGHSLAADKDGNVWACGDNDVGQLGNHSRIGSLLPVKLAAPQHAKAVATGGNHSLALL